MDVRHITPEGVQRCRPDDIDALLDGPGLVWIDVKYWDAETARPRQSARPASAGGARLRGAQPGAEGLRLPRPVFVVLHAPERGARGHVHHVELDQFVGPNWLLTVHGPMDAAVPLDAAYVETASSPAGWRADGCARPGRRAVRARWSPC